MFAKNPLLNHHESDVVWIQSNSHIYIYIYGQLCTATSSELIAAWLSTAKYINKLENNPIWQSANPSAPPTMVSVNFQLDKFRVESISNHSTKSASKCENSLEEATFQGFYIANRGLNKYIYIYILYIYLLKSKYIDPFRVDYPAIYVRVGGVFVGFTSSSPWFSLV